MRLNNKACDNEEHTSGLPTATSRVVLPKEDGTTAFHTLPLPPVSSSLGVSKGPTEQTLFRTHHSHSALKPPGPANLESPLVTRISTCCPSSHQCFYPWALLHGPYSDPGFPSIGLFIVPHEILGY